MVLASLVTLPAVAQAKAVTIDTQLSQYRGDGAYLAIYLTDARGVYQQTLWVAGKKSKYYKHLSDWARGSQRSRAEYDGLTGASITRGETLQISVNLDETLIDSGYQIRVDAAVEDMDDQPAAVIAPLTTAGAGTPIRGQGYIQSLTYTF
ncbi:DUF2271 domain-containing protein [Marinobacterium sp. A346]|uniref:DUF2271 domain-containing protein n=2 Tax=Marinobacterium weihaiense TaxID=2851016 RepID=A0ABS6MEC5_9GAMM|nr:DUF2271 domain-containing protein [Marinobacterium weihaiense]